MRQEQSRTATNEELAILAKQGDKDAEVQLWNQIKSLVWIKARHLLPEDGSTARYDIDDLMQEAYFGVREAIKAYDPGSGFLFTTYLTFPLKSAFRRVQGIGSTRRDAVLHAISMDTPLGDDDYSLSDTLTAPAAEESFEGMLDRAEAEETAEIVRRCVDRLDALHADVIRRHYFAGQALQQIADQRGCSRENINQVLQHAVLRLRKYKEIRRLAAEVYFDRHANFNRHAGARAFQSWRPSVVESAAEGHEWMTKNALLCR